MISFSDETIIPTFYQLQRGLLNDPEHIGIMVQITMALLHQCLCDPGVPAPGPWVRVYYIQKSISYLSRINLCFVLTSLHYFYSSIVP